MWSTVTAQAASQFQCPQFHSEHALKIKEWIFCYRCLFGDTWIIEWVQNVYKIQDISKYYFSNQKNVTGVVCISLKKAAYCVTDHVSNIHPFIFNYTPYLSGHWKAGGNYSLFCSRGRETFGRSRIYCRANTVSFTYTCMDNLEWPVNLIFEVSQSTRRKPTKAWGEHATRFENRTF